MIFEYPNAFVLAVHDGDTCTLDIDQGFNVWTRNLKARLYDINAPELSAPGGIAARDFLASKVLNQQVRLRSYKESPVDKYGGRYDLIVILADGTNVNDLMLSSGNAVPMP